MVKKACDNYVKQYGEPPDNSIIKDKYNGKSPFKVWKNY